VLAANGEEEEEEKSVLEGGIDAAKKLCAYVLKEVEHEK
jgi:hypothetical protein